MLYPWRQVATILGAISLRLGFEKECRGFLSSFAEQRLRLPQEKVKPILSPSGHTKKEGLGLIEHPLIKLQAEMVRVSVKLTRYFGLRLAEEKRSIQNIDDCSVDFIVSEEGSQRLDVTRECVDRLFGAVDLALELKNMEKEEAESPYLEDVSGAKRQLERKHVYRKLLGLLLCLIGSQRELYAVRLGKHYDGGRLPVYPEIGNIPWSLRGKLRLDEIQWMSDLLWYTIRYWVPWYPTTAELAFEISLLVKEGPPRRAELAQAAQALENRDNLNLSDRTGSKRLAQFLGDLVTYCEKVQERKESPGWQTKAFYYAIASVMQCQYEEYKKAVETGSKRRLIDELDNQNEKVSTPVPIVFTTNFDCALEKIFKEHDVPFHAVYPVLRGRREDKEFGTPIWMLETIHEKTERRKDNTQQWESVCNPKTWVPEITFAGPLIVKLHGSPSLPLDEEVQQHWIVLSEAGYLDSLGDGFKVPRWLGRQLASKEGLGASPQEARSLWFLGYSISDWNVRLRLYEHCNEHRRLLGGRRSTVDRPADIYRTAILGRLDVSQCEGDLNEIPYMVLETFEDNNLAGSEKLKALVNGIKKHLPRYKEWKAI